VPDQVTNAGELKQDHGARPCIGQRSSFHA
jgi:hypothetical protein